jgi:hypothetical protein
MTCPSPARRFGVRPLPVIALGAMFLAPFAVSAPVLAAPFPVALPAAVLASPAEPARSALRNFLDALAEDDVHDDHYDGYGYREPMSRKERMRDYFEAQREMQKDYWKGQKEMQKRAIKAQRGW